jgi:ETC complex I subunit conserved region
VPGLLPPKVRATLRVPLHQLRWVPSSCREGFGLDPGPQFHQSPRMTQARIIQKSKNAMQSGRAGCGEWVLEFVPADAQRPDPLMGWAGSADTRRQVKLTFPSLAAAQAYADKNGINCAVVSAAPKVLKLQAYADNFR